MKFKNLFLILNKVGLYFMRQKLPKINFKAIFIVFFVVASLIFAGCTKIEDCSLQDTTYTKYSWDDETSTCKEFETIEEDVCGNGVVEDTETYCNCDDDVKKTHPLLGCDGDLGEYLEYTCTAEKECELTQNEKVVEQTKSVEFKNSDLVFRGKFRVNTPFILGTYDSNTIDVDVDLFKTLGSGIKLRDIVVKEMSLENSAGISFGTQTYDEPVQTVGTALKTKYFSLADTTKYSTDETLKAKLVVTYVKDFLDSQGQVTKTENKVETLTINLGKWKIINPNFYK